MSTYLARLILGMDVVLLARAILIEMLGQSFSGIGRAAEVVCHDDSEAGASCWETVGWRICCWRARILLGAKSTERRLGRERRQKRWVGCRLSGCDCGQNNGW